MAARALWKLAKDPEEVLYSSAMALIEISAVAEENADLRRSAFKPNSPACKAVIDQLFSVLEKGDSELLVPCVKAVGNLARTFRATETRMISPLVKVLDLEVSREACAALTKFACSDNYLHLDHSEAIIGAGGSKHLVQLVYFGEHDLCIGSAFWSTSAYGDGMGRNKLLFVQDEEVAKLLVEAIGKLELYHSTASRGYR